MENNKEEFLENNGEQFMEKNKAVREPLYFTRPKNAGAVLLFAALAFLNALPLKADIAGFNTNGVNFVQSGTWYLDEGRTIRLAEFRVNQLIASLDGSIIDEAAYFPRSGLRNFRFLADSSSSDKVAKFSGNEANWHQKPLLRFTDGHLSYLPYYRTRRDLGTHSVIAFADGIWGNFEPDPNQSGYFGFRFDLDGDGDDSIDQFQYGWARISFSEIVDTPSDDSFSITLHEWAWGGIDETDFRIGQIPEPSTLGLMATAGLAMYLAGRRKKRRG